VQLHPQISLQTILTDSLINPNGTPFVDVNSKRVITTTGDNSAIARDMHRRMLNMVTIGSPISKEENSKARPSLYCTDVDNYPPITPQPVDLVATRESRPSEEQEQPQQCVDMSEEEGDHSQPKERDCESPTISTRKVRLLSSPTAPDLHQYFTKTTNTPPKTRPHSAHASIARPLFHSESSNQLNHSNNSGIAFASAVDDNATQEDRKRIKNQKLHQLQMEQKQWALRLGQTASRDYGLPDDLFDLDMCAATSKVSPETGIRFLKSMASKPSIYDGLRPRRRPQSAGKQHSCGR